MANQQADRRHGPTTDGRRPQFPAMGEKRLCRYLIGRLPHLTGVHNGKALRELRRGKVGVSTKHGQIFVPRYCLKLLDP